MKIAKHTVVIIEQQSDSFIVKCGYCKGSGKWIGEKCYVCDGLGSVRLTIQSNLTCEDIGLLKCAMCKGSGFHDYYPYHYSNPNSFERTGCICPACKGVGSFIKCFPRIECTNCKGSGQNNTKGQCPTCSGAGSVWSGDLITY